MEGQIAFTIFGKYTIKIRKTQEELDGRGSGSNGG